MEQFERLAKLLKDYSFNSGGSKPDLVVAWLGETPVAISAYVSTTNLLILFPDGTWRLTK